jgi:hypothetical protein
LGTRPRRFLFLFFPFCDGRPGFVSPETGSGSWRDDGAVLRTRYRPPALHSVSAHGLGRSSLTCNKQTSILACLPRSGRTIGGAAALSGHARVFVLTQDASSFICQPCQLARIIGQHPLPSPSLPFSFLDAKAERLGHSNVHVSPTGTRSFRCGLTACRRNRGNKVWRSTLPNVVPSPKRKKKTKVCCETVLSWYVLTGKERREDE